MYGLWINVFLFTDCRIRYDNYDVRVWSKDINISCKC